MFSVPFIIIKPLNVEHLEIQHYRRVGNIQRRRGAVKINRHWSGRINWCLLLPEKKGWIPLSYYSHYGGEKEKKVWGSVSGSCTRRSGIWVNTTQFTVNWIRNNKHMAFTIPSNVAPCPLSKQMSHHRQRHVLRWITIYRIGGKL